MIITIVNVRFYIGLIMKMNVHILFNHNTMLLNFVTAFRVKLPVFSLYIWLPKAHVEAPLAGSIVLAAILLQVYGIIRIRKIILTSIERIN